MVPRPESYCDFTYQVVGEAWRHGSKGNGGSGSQQTARAQTVLSATGVSRDRTCTLPVSPVWDHRICAWHVELMHPDMGQWWWRWFHREHRAFRKQRRKGRQKLTFEFLQIDSAIHATANTHQTLKMSTVGCGWQHLGDRKTRQGSDAFRRTEATEAPADARITTPGEVLCGGGGGGGRS